MFEQEKRCATCLGPIKEGDPIELLYEDQGNKLVAHKGKCFEAYKEYLTGKTEIKRGMIVGVCPICLKPVRHLDDYTFYRIIPEHDIGKFKGTKFEYFLSTIPLVKDIWYFHMQCYFDLGLNLKERIDSLKREVTMCN